MWGGDHPIRFVRGQLRPQVIDHNEEHIQRFGGLAQTGETQANDEKKDSQWR